MYRIGLNLDSHTTNGGSYQFWLALVKAFSELNRERYDVIAFTSGDSWKEIGKQLQLPVVVLNEKKSWLNQRIENNFRGFHTIPLVGRILSYLYKKFDCNLQIIKKENLQFWVSRSVEGVGDLLQVPTMMPIFDLMHRYEREFQEVAVEYNEREKFYSYQCQKAEIILVDSVMGKNHVVESYGYLRNDLSKHIEVLPFIPPDYIYSTNMIETASFTVPEKFIFYPAQFWSHKNHKNLLLAQKKLKDMGITVKTVFVGSEQNNRTNVEALIHEQELGEDVSILGYVTNEEMVYLYKHARALVMPTFFGPTNIPQLEAFELGCPVATSGIYGIPEQVGDAALLFDPNSVDEIADAMKALWTDDQVCEELIKRGKTRAQQWGQKQFNIRVKEIIEAHLNKE